MQRNIGETDMMTFIKEYWKSSLLGALGALLLLYIGLLIYDGLTPERNTRSSRCKRLQHRKTLTTRCSTWRTLARERMARRSAHPTAKDQTRAYQGKYPPKPCTEEHRPHPPHRRYHSCTTTTPNRCQDAPYTATAENGCCRNILRDTRW